MLRNARIGGLAGALEPEASVRHDLEQLIQDRSRPGDSGEGRHRAIIAFSGGPDSLALLIASLAPARGLGVELIAAHIDHRLDAESTRRARHARALSRTLRVPWATMCLDPKLDLCGPGGLEAQARRARYAALERLRQRYDAMAILTAHHADDQAETVLLRVQSGTGWRGLSSIAPRRGYVVRPLLACSRAALQSVVDAAGPRLPGLTPNDDPANRDPRFMRSAVRHHILPILRTEDPTLDLRLTRLAAVARRAREVVDRRLDVALGLHRDRPRFGAPEVWSLDREALRTMPAALRRAGIDRLANRSGRPFGIGREAFRAFEAQQARPGAIGLDVGDGWRLVADDRRLRLLPPFEAPRAFVYDLEVPGRVRIAPIDCDVTVTPQGVEDWMFGAEPQRAAVASRPARSGVRPWTVQRWTVRNRRPGDRFRPLGSPGSRRLKDVLIDRRMPRHLRDRLPLVCIDGRIAWVPGIGIDHRFRIDPKDTRAVAIEVEDVAGCRSGEETGIFGLRTWLRE